MLRLLAILGLALLGLGLLAGCGEEEEGEATPSPEATPGATPTLIPTAGLGKLALVRGGDIWVLELDSGQERQLTTDGVNTGVRWSADGRWVAFVKVATGAIWVTQEDGSDATLVGESGRVGPIWAPSDNRLAYATSGGVLWVVDIESGERQQLSPPNREVSRLTWLPDGTGLILEMWEKQELATPSPASMVDQGLWRINADGTGPVELYSMWEPGTLNEVNLGTLSPDGQRLTFWEGSVSASLRADGLPLRIMPAGGGEAQEIASATLLGPEFAVWSAESDRLAVVEGAGRATWVNKQIVVVQPDGSERRLLSDADRADLFPAWSPDGQHIAFTSGETSGFESPHEERGEMLATRRIWVVDGDGSNKRQLTDDPAHVDQFPQWSADGAHILFIRQQGEAIRGGDELAPAEIWLMKADGSEQRKVTDRVFGSWFGYYGYFPWADLVDWYR